MCAAKGLVYSNCGKTCDNFRISEQDLRCSSGCFCEEGKVLHENGTCVDPNNECQCKEADRYFSKGEISPSDCSKYVFINFIYILCKQTYMFSLCCFIKLIAISTSFELLKIVYRGIHANQNTAVKIHLGYRC